jgi:hypothetical protein
MFHCPPDRLDVRWLRWLAVLERGTPAPQTPEEMTYG